MKTKTLVVVKTAADYAAFVSGMVKEMRTNQMLEYRITCPAGEIKIGVAFGTIIVRDMGRMVSVGRLNYDEVSGLKGMLGL